MMKKISILFMILAFAFSCKEHYVVENARKYEKELAKNYPITLNSIEVYEGEGNYYLEFSGTITNKTEHFLDELMIYPSIDYKKSSGDYGYLKFEPIRIVSNGKSFDSNNSISFSDKFRFNDFNSDNLKYKFDEVTLDIFLKGKNSTGYVLGEDFTVNGMTWQPAKTVEITDEWENILR